MLLAVPSMLVEIGNIGCVWPPTPLIGAALVKPTEDDADPEVVENALTSETDDGFVVFIDDEAVGVCV